MAWAWTTAAILILPTRLVGARRFIPRRWVRGLSYVSMITCMPDVPESWLGIIVTGEGGNGDIERLE